MTIAFSVYIYPYICRFQPILNHQTSQKLRGGRSKGGKRESLRCLRKSSEERGQTD